MAYEYNEVIAMLEYIGDEYKEDKYYRMARQVEEAYAKAKVLDEIEKHMKEIHNEFKGNINEIHRLLGQETEFIIEDMEDK